MKYAPVFSGKSPGAHSLSNLLTRWFPMPQVLLPRAIGVDISDSSIKWLVLEGLPGKRRIHSYGQEPLEHGIVVDGTVHDVPRLAEAAVVFPTQCALSCVCCYLFPLSSQH